MSTQTEPLRREILVVTGASTRIGCATARELARRGFHVLAGVRRGTDADALRATNLEPIMLDITNEAEIAMLVKRIADDPDRRPLRALVNNAGIQVNAPVEALPLSEWRRLFVVNLFGHVAMTQALLPTLIAMYSGSNQHWHRSKPQGSNDQKIDTKNLSLQLHNTV